MTCRETVRLICEYLECRLSRPVEWLVQRHLSHCDDCRLVLQAAQKTLEVDFDGDEHVKPERRARVA
jgi:hypothetical protein